MNDGSGTALVIGATSDVGRAVARRLAAGGWALLLAGRDPARVEERGSRRPPQGSAARLRLFGIFGPGSRGLGSAVVDPDGPRPIGRAAGMSTIVRICIDRPPVVVDEPDVKRASRVGHGELVGAGPVRLPGVVGVFGRDRADAGKGGHGAGTATGTRARRQAGGVGGGRCHVHRGRRERRGVGVVAARGEPEPAEQQRGGGEVRTESSHANNLQVFGYRIEAKIHERHVPGVPLRPGPVEPLRSPLLRAIILHVGTWSPYLQRLGWSCQSHGDGGGYNGRTDRASWSCPGSSRPARSGQERR